MKKIRDAETTILIKFAFWRGNFTEKLSQNAVFPGNSMTIKFGNFANFIVRILLSFGRLLEKEENLARCLRFYQDEKKA